MVMVRGSVLIPLCVAVIYLPRGTFTSDCSAVCDCLGAIVDCSEKSLTSFPTDIPLWTKQLHVNNNRIRHLKEGVLDNLHNLTELKVNRNRISLIPKEFFRHQTHLRVLELNRNHISNLEALTLNNLGKLTILKLKRNRITHLSDGAFWGLKSIVTLDLSFNSITEVTKAWTYGLYNLKILLLSQNRISHIEADVWENCKELTELNLSSNRLESIQKWMFLQLSNLEKLNLNDNNISFIEEGTFSALPHLKVLQLEGNRISWTVEDGNGTFSALTALANLRLARNNIKSINRNAFVGLRNVKHLNLEKNNIQSVQKNAFSDMVSLQELLLTTSNLLCDCNIRWFAVWLRTVRFNITAECEYPMWFRGKSILNLPVSNFTCDDLPKPMLIEEPKTQMAIKGLNASLHCKAMSSSTNQMNFVWKKENMELIGANVNELASSSDGKHTEYASELLLVNVSHSDAGRYQCIASNKFGTTYSQKAKVSVVIFPKFVKTPSNMTIEAGKTARLECAAEGEPQPQIAWQKDGGNDFPAARERRMHVMMPSDDVFFIVNVKTADMGVYSCTANNPAGIIIANASLLVLETPSFVRPMENKETTAGESIVLDCRANGSPKPTLTWLKDGGPFKKTERHFFTAEDQLMIIVNTVMSDAGLYECVMNNSMGTERGYSELVIKPGITENSVDKVGLIIITVVCCAVLTSLVWFIIIYQIRKRANRAVATPPSNFQEAVIVRPFTDNISDHSSCKDSGTGDSSKRSNDDLLPSDDFNFPISENSNSPVPTVPSLQEHHTPTDNNSQTPLLQEPVNQLNSTRLTNHDRSADLQATK